MGLSAPRWGWWRLHILLLGGWDMGPLSCDDQVQSEPGAGGLDRVLVVQVGVVGLEPLAVEPAVLRVVPSGPPSGALQRLRLALHHLALQLVLDGFRFRLKLLDLGHQVKVGADPCVHHVHAHCVYLLLI